MSRTRSSRKAHYTRMFLVLAIVGGVGLVSYTWVQRQLREATMSEMVSNTRSFKLASDVFAMDNDGVYPNVETAEFYDQPDPKSSNDFFRQLHTSKNTNSERIFWVPKSRICNPHPPDDVTTMGGKFATAETLQAGDNHWAYIVDLDNVSNPEAPIIVEPYLPGTSNFDRKLWNNHALVVRVDSSAKFHLLTSGGILLDPQGRNLLSSESQIWDGLAPKLRQPDPSPGAQ